MPKIHSSRSGTAAAPTAPVQPTSLRELLAGDVLSAAAGLIGCVLVRRLGSAGRVLRAQIIEAEAYHEREPGCHAYRGRTPRTEVMFGLPGRLYVYFTYGMWHCANVVCEPAGTAAAVLLRGAVLLDPATEDEVRLRLSGPGLLCRSLQLDRRDNGAELLSRRGELWLYRPRGLQPPPLQWTTRIGLTQARELPWRCCWHNHPALSRR